MTPVRIPVPVSSRNAAEKFVSKFTERSASDASDPDPADCVIPVLPMAVK